MRGKQRLALALAGLAAVGAGVAWRQQGAAPEVRLTPTTAGGTSTPSTASAPVPPAGATLLASVVEQDMPLGAQLAQLLATGLPQDAYTAYLLIAECTSHNAGHTFNALPDRRGAQPPLPAQERQRLDRMCTGMTERQRQARLDYLAAAVKGGVPGAALQHLTVGPFGDPSALETRPDDPLVREWKAGAIAQVEQAAEAGDFAALLVWGLRKLNGDALAARDPQLGYGYLLAFGLIQAHRFGANDPGAQAYREGSDMMNGFGYALTAQQRAAALTIARRIADQVRAREAGT